MGLLAGNGATAHGALLGHLMHASPKRFQPMNVNFGLFLPLVRRASDPKKLRKREKNERLAERALESIDGFAARTAALVE